MPHRVKKKTIKDSAHKKYARPDIFVEEIVPVLDYIASIIFVLLVFHPAIYEPSDHGLRLTCNKQIRR